MEKGLIVNLGNTKAMKHEARFGQQKTEEIGHVECAEKALVQIV